MSGGKGSSKSQQVTQEVKIPDELKPLINANVGYALQDIPHLRNIVSGSLGSGSFTGWEDGALRKMAERAQHGGSSAPLRNQLRRIAGQSLGDRIGDHTARNLGSLTHKRDLSAFVDGTGLQALRDTAGGNFLHGGDGFNAALAAANDASQKRIGSMFSGTSGLAQASMADEVGRNFAGLFDSERGRQLSAANALSALSDAEAGRRQTAINDYANERKDLQTTKLQAASMIPEAENMELKNLFDIGGRFRQNNLDVQARDQAMLQNLIGVEMGTVNPSSLMGSTSTQPLHSNGMASGLGTAMGVASLMKGNPMGAIGGLFGGGKGGGG